MFPKFIKYLKLDLFYIVLKLNHQSNNDMSSLYKTGLILIYFLEGDISSMNTLLEYYPKALLKKFQVTV